MTDPRPDLLRQIDAEYTASFASGDPLHNEAAMRGEGWSERAPERLSADLAKSRGVRLETEAETIVRLSAELDQVHKINRKIYRSYASKSYELGVLTEKNEQLTEKNAEVTAKCAELTERCARMENDRPWAGLVVFICAVLWAARYVGSKVGGL